MGKKRGLHFCIYTDVNRLCIEERERIVTVEAWRRKVSGGDEILTSRSVSFCLACSEVAFLGSYKKPFFLSF